jgi:hypothetical protein
MLSTETPTAFVENSQLTITHSVDIIRQTLCRIALQYPEQRCSFSEQLHASQQIRWFQAFLYILSTGRPTVFVGKYRLTASNLD